MQNSAASLTPRLKAGDQPSSSSSPITISEVNPPNNNSGAIALSNDLVLGCFMKRLRSVMRSGVLPRQHAADDEAHYIEKCKQPGFPPVPLPRR